MKRTILYLVSVKVYELTAQQTQLFPGQWSAGLKRMGGRGDHLLLLLFGCVHHDWGEWAG